MLADECGAILSRLSLTDANTGIEPKIRIGGRCGIRTHGDPEATTAFEAAPFVRSGNLPGVSLSLGASLTINKGLYICGCSRWSSFRPKVTCDAHKHLVPTVTDTHTWSVGDLCQAIRDTFFVVAPEEIWVEGEIAGLNVASSGHVYFDVIEPNSEGSRGQNVCCSVEDAGRESRLF